MAQPKVEILTSKPAVPQNGAVIDVLVRITPPLPEVHFVRPAINLGLVLDRSGSMAGSKIFSAREAAIFAVGQLLPTDRVSVTIFDNMIQTIVESTPATDKPAIIEKIRTITARGATALHGGWKAGADQVERHLAKSGLNRVILLSDGHANEGVTDPNVIARECTARASRGVSTTTMGLGQDYNEDLMQRMAKAGDGNYCFIETAEQLADIFHGEMMGLMANVGTKVSLGVETQAGSLVSEVLNTMDRGPLGRLKLPNLSVGMPIQVVMRLSVPQLTGSAEIARFRLAWDDPKTGDRCSVYVGLALPVVTQAQWDAMPANPEVADQVLIQLMARAKEEAVAKYDAGDIPGSLRTLTRARQELGECLTQASASQLLEFAEVQADLERGNAKIFRKKALWQSYKTWTGRR